MGQAKFNSYLNSINLDIMSKDSYTFFRKAGITMRSIKTAISMRESLFEQAEAYARKLKVSRSRLFVLALEEYIRRQQSRELLAQINATYGNESAVEDDTLHKRQRRTHRRLVDGEW